MKTSLTLIAATLLGACATPPAPPPEPDAGAWQSVLLPGKRATQYAWEFKDGRRALAAQADASASLWRRRLAVAPADLGEVRFSWWVAAPLAGADLAAPGRDDAPARLVFAFDGDHGRLSARDRLMFDLAETLSGERPPYATLMYVYGNEGLQPGEVLVHARTDRVRKIVVDAGQADAGRWREHRRALAEDFRRAFGEEPGPLMSVALMTDADNTRQTARAWYGPVEFGPAGGGR